MAEDIFQYWAKASPDDKIHPCDRKVFERANDRGFGFDLNCLPWPFSGPLKTARVVLLYLSPGLSPYDFEEAKMPEGRLRSAKRRTGDQPLVNPDEHKPAWDWWSSRTKGFGSWEKLREKLAFLNISPYHSREFTDYSALSALPSCRVTLDWAQAVLFSQAERGERVVVCMRSANYWGLGKPRSGISLFAPTVTRSGYFVRESSGEVVQAIKAALE